MSPWRTDPPDPAAPPHGDHQDASLRLAELAAAVAARDNFIAVAAHELRNPMTPMIGQIELLLMALRAGKCTLGQVEDRLARIQRSMAHYLKRTTTLLDISRISSGKFRMAPAPCDLADIIRFVAENFEDSARHAGAALDVDVPAALPGSWDRLALEQIIDNLVSNAIKYGARSVVRVSAAPAPDPAWVIIEVRDQGPGISARDKERIFGQFERAIGADEQQTGFGVGLWVVGQIVEAMGGSIAVTDAQGGGAMFSILLPNSPGSGSARPDRHE